MTTTKLLPVGTRIRFIQNLFYLVPRERRAVIYALKNDLGVVTGYSTLGDYWVKVDHWPNEFRAKYETEFIQESHRCDKVN